jgi:hypothetical protein
MPLRSAITSLFLGDTTPTVDPQPAAAERSIQVHQAEPIKPAEVMQQFESQLASQADVNRRLGELIRQLDGTLSALPEMARQQARMVDTLIDQAQRAKDRDAALTRGLKELSEGSDRQTQVLGLVQQQLDLHSETSSRVAEILGEARTALGAFSATSERHARSIESLAEATRRRTIQSDRLERRLQLWLIVTTALSTTALVYAFVVALRDAPQTQNATVPPVVVTEPGVTNGAEPATTLQANAPTATNGAAAAPTTTKPSVTAPEATNAASSGAAASEPATVDPVAPGVVRGAWSEPIEP